MPRTEGYKHLDGCRLKPSNGEGPIDTAAGAPRDSPRDNAQSRAVIRTMILTEDGKKKNIVEVPSECVFAGCKTQVGKYNAKALLKHFADTHGSGTDRLRTCPICDLDFSKREWTRKDDKVGHFRDHIERREKRLVLDLKIADKPNKLDAEVTELIRSRNLDEFSPAKKEVPVTHVSQDNSQMLAALNRVASDVKTGVNQTVNTFTTKLVCEMHGRDYILNQDIGTIKDRVDEVDMASKLNAEEMLDLMTNVKWCLDRLGDIETSLRDAELTREPVKRKRSDEDSLTGGSTSKKSRSIDTIDEEISSPLISPSTPRELPDDTGPTGTRTPFTIIEPPVSSVSANSSIISSQDGNLEETIITTPATYRPTTLEPQSPLKPAIFGGQELPPSVPILPGWGSEGSSGRSVIRGLPQPIPAFSRTRARVAKVQKSRLDEPIDEYDDIVQVEEEEVGEEEEAGEEEYSDDGLEW